MSGWQDSRGAKLEDTVARELGRAILDAVTLRALENIPTPAVDLHRLLLVEPPQNESILDEAKCITEGTRRGEYGAPADDFARAGLYLARPAQVARSGLRAAAAIALRAEGFGDVGGAPTDTVDLSALVPADPPEREPPAPPLPDPGPLPVRCFASPDSSAR